MANKITFIYDYKDGETWSTPMSLVNEFKKRNWEVDIIKTNDTDLKNWIDSKPQTDIVVFVHTNSDRIPTANEEIGTIDHSNPGQNEAGRAIQLYYKYIHDPQFLQWAQQQWFKEINTRWAHLKTIHFHCFPDSVKHSHLLPGMVFTTPLIHISIGELSGTDKEIDKLILEDQRYNHLSAANNQILADIILRSIYKYRPGQYRLDLNEFQLVNPNSVKFPLKGYGTI